MAFFLLLLLIYRHRVLHSLPPSSRLTDSTSRGLNHPRDILPRELSCGGHHSRFAYQSTGKSAFTEPRCRFQALRCRFERTKGMKQKVAGISMFAAREGFRGLAWWRSDELGVTGDNGSSRWGLGDTAFDQAGA